MFSRVLHADFKGPKNQVYCFIILLLKDLNIFFPVYLSAFSLGCCLFLNDLWFHGTLK